MTLPLRIELAITFKAVFLVFWPGTDQDMDVRRPAKRFGLQHTDFAASCQHFTTRKSNLGITGHEATTRSNSRQRCTPCGSTTLAMVDPCAPRRYQAIPGGEERHYPLGKGMVRGGAVCRG